MANLKIKEWGAAITEEFLRKDAIVITTGAGANVAKARVTRPFQGRNYVMDYQGIGAMACGAPPL